MLHYGKTHMAIPIKFNYGRATFDCMSERGQRIRDLRKAKLLNQTQLAAAVGIDQSTVSDIEKGAGFSVDILDPLAATQSPESRARQQAREAVKQCWREQERKSNSPGSQQFIAGVCEKMEADLRSK